MKQGYLTEQFLNQLLELRNKSFSEEEKVIAKLCLLDYLGVTFAGAKILEAKHQSLFEVFEECGNYTPIGASLETSISSAVFINGLSAHIAELDDGVILSSVHPGSPLFSTLLPVLKKYRCSGEDLLKIILIGYEAIVRLSNAIQPSHKQLGYHATATCGAIGSAIALGMLMNFDAVKLKAAFSAAIISAGGSLKAIEDNSEFKPFNVANASRNALTAVSMAKAGYQGPEDPLLGSRGMLSLMSKNYNTAELIKPTEAPLSIKDVYFKPYAACRYCHPAIDAILHIRASPGFDLHEIDKIRIRTYELAVFNHDHIEIPNVSSAKMSIPFSVAVALVTGNASLGEFEDKTLSDQTIVDLTKKVEVIVDPIATQQFPKKSMASVEVVLKSRDQLDYAVDYPKGEPQNPMSLGEIRDKFYSLMRFAGKDEALISTIYDKVQNLEYDCKELVDIL